MKATAIILAVVLLVLAALLGHVGEYRTLAHVGEYFTWVGAHVGEYRIAR